MSSIIVEEWRDLWSFKVDFLFAAFAWVFASGNLFNFGNLVQDHGGVVFVIAYVACVLAVCLPIIVMELGVGQLTGRAPIQALFNMCPLFKGVGVAQIIYSLAVMSYMVITLSYILLCIFFLFWNIMGDMPWANCLNYFNTERCDNVTKPFEIQPKQWEHSGFMEFLNNLIQPSKSIEDPVQLEWILIAGLGVAWFLVFLAIFAGVRWLGKVCYFTFLIPLVLLFAILVRALTIYKGTDYIVTLLEPNWDLLLKTSTWNAAMSRAIYSTGVGMGVFITLGSYTKRQNNLVGDSFLIVFVHLLTLGLQLFTPLMLAGVFLEGNAGEQEKIFDYKGNEFLYRLIASFTALPVNKLWTAILLFAVAFLFLNSFYILSLSLLASAEDALGEKASRCFPRLGLALAIACSGFVVSLGHTTQAGVFAVRLMEIFMDQLTLWVILVFELLAIAWFYCAHLLGRDIRGMVSNACCWVTGYFFMEILYIMPAAPIFVIVMRVMDYDSAKSLVEKQVGVEDWVEPVGWLIAILPLLPIPIFMIYIIIRTCLRGPGLTHWQRFKYTIVSPLRYEIVKPTPPSRYNAHAPGYVLLPQAPLAEPEMEQDMYTERVVKVSNI